MSNPLTGTLTIRLDRPRVAVLDMNALCRVEATTGKNALELFAELGRGFQAYIAAQAARAADPSISLPPLPINVTMLRTILWAVLVDDDPKLTEEALGRLINPGNFQALAESLNKLMSISSAPGSEQPAGDPPGNGNGSHPAASSGPTADTTLGSQTPISSN